jgi:hypothetical protein
MAQVLLYVDPWRSLIGNPVVNQIIWESSCKSDLVRRKTLLNFANEANFEAKTQKTRKKKDILGFYHAIINILNGSVI